MAYSFNGRIEILDRDSYKTDKTCLSVLIHGEDHTLGNALSYTLNDMDGVVFAGYNVPHPLEDSIMVRIQTKEHYDAGEVLLKACDLLELTFKTIQTKFTEAKSEFDAINK
uniref:DNA-directed RNA polymerase I subunit D n=1 Tax=Panagrellus redivivus TaxID=6233 RepID=A0A7E4UTK6_PANRE